MPEDMERIEEVISTARREGKTQAFNLNSLLIKPVQRVTKYPLLLEQVRPLLLLLFYLLLPESVYSLY